MGSQLNLPHGTKKKNRKNNEETRVMKKTKNENGDAQKNGPVMKSVKSVLRPEGSLL